MISATATVELSGYMKAVFAELNDPKTFYVDVKQQDCTIGTGCEWHPSVKEHTRSPPCSSRSSSRSSAGNGGR